MSAAANKTFIRRYVDALSGVDKTPDLVRPFAADEQLIQHIAAIESGFPRYELSVDDMVAEDDKVALRATFRGTHTREFAGLAPTQRQVTQPFIIIYRVADEKIVEHWIGIDMLSFMQQLGAVPEAEAAAAGH
jgi:predicted ester cyclase